MNKVKTRALSVLILVAIAILGMGFYFVRLVLFGGDWVSAPFNRTVFNNGVLSIGVVNDRNGVELAGVTDGKRSFAESREIRRATLHVVGDRNGNIGTGALLAFAPELTGYNIITGSYSLSNTGKQIALTIDSKLNASALSALDGRRGTVIVSNYKTGEILCMISSPTFDPADPPDNLYSDAYDGIFMNRAIQSAYTPGSTFKLITAAAAIEQVRGIYSRTFNCEGEMEIGRDILRCSATHGTINFEEGLQESCNVVFGELALEMGAATLAEYAEKYRFTERITISGIQSAAGNFQEAAPGSINLAWSGVGQFTNTVCPATMLRFVSAVANEGKAVQLHYLKRTGFTSIFPAGSEQVLNRNTAVQLDEIMIDSRNTSLKGIDVHAKTGTAQVGRGNEPHAWYAGYLKSDEHPLAFVVVIENGGGGRAAATPVANRVLQRAIEG